MPACFAVRLIYSFMFMSIFLVEGFKESLQRLFILLRLPPLHKLFLKLMLKKDCMNYVKTVLIILLGYGGEDCFIH